MEEITRILSQIDQGDEGAAERLLPLVYDELRELADCRMANERSDHTLQGTALVHEAYLRLVSPDGGASWQNRGHFFAAAASAMRRILVESARAKNCQKRGGDWKRVELLDVAAAELPPHDMMLDFDGILCQLAEEDEESAKLVELRLFAGLSVTEAGKMLGMSRSTAYENWEFARSWLSIQFGNLAT